MAKNNQDISTEELIDAIVFGIQEKKGVDLDILNFKSIPNSVSDYFIICHATVKIQVEAIAESVEVEVKKKTGLHPWHKEGKENAEWILLDYVDVVVHVFLDSARSFYHIEKLWGDAEIKRIENLQNNDDVS